MKVPVKRISYIVALVVAITFGLVWYVRGEGDAPATLETAPVKRGDLVSTISATGTVEPVEVVDVGAQVVGRIVSFGKDRHGKTIDYGSSVEAGTVLARIDDSTYAAEVAQATAQLEQDKAAVTRALADLDQSRAKRVQAQRDWDRAQELDTSKIISRSDYDGAEANFEVAKADVGVSEAAVTEAQKAELQASAALDRAKLSLSYCTIKSPVKGVIIDRRVNIGQTVVSSLNAPSLFLIAKDLGHMQVWVSVNEADIGSIHPGQPATFTVDAFPGRTFRGTVNKVRLNAAMTQNVVTYTVEVDTDNSDGKLLPYLTANVEFEASRASDALLVPNAALRWQPPPGRAPGKAGGGRAAHAEPGSMRAGGGTVWVEAGDKLQPVSVKPGISDGVSTAVESGGLQEGMQVVVGERRGDMGPSVAGATPFTPQWHRRRPESEQRQQ